MKEVIHSQFLKLPLEGIDLYPQECVKSSVEMKAPHHHDFYEIYYLISGERNYLIGDKVHKVMPGDMVFIRPYEIHRATNTSVRYHERIVIHFSKQFLAQDGEWLEDPDSPFATQTSVLSLPVNSQKRVEELLYRIVTEYRERDKGFETTIKAALLELLVISVRLNRVATDKAFEYATPIHQKISEIVRFINENHEKTLSLTSLAEYFHINPFYLSKLFKKTIGISYIEYLTLVRIKKAQRLLRETKWSVSLIAEKAGYLDFAHFGKTFKKISNCTPLQYRKMYRK